MSNIIGADDILACSRRPLLVKTIVNKLVPSLDGLVNTIGARCYDLAERSDRDQLAHRFRMVAKKSHPELIYRRLHHCAERALARLLGKGGVTLGRPLHICFVTSDLPGAHKKGGTAHIPLKAIWSVAI